MKKTFLLSVFISLLHVAQAQTQDHEFPKGWVVNAEYFNGFTSQFHANPELFLTELRLTPQYTIVPKVLRVGASAGLQYNNKHVSALFGPNLAFKIKTVNVEKFNSSLLNFQWVLENLWGTDKQQLVGTGFRVELGQKLLISVTGDRDFNLNYWRLQFGIGINLIKSPKVPDL